MKNTLIIVLVVLGMYWSVDHSSPLPFSHESFGLYYHNIHGLVGVILLAIAAFFTWKWRLRKSN